MTKKSVSTILNKLYKKVEVFDDMQEKLIDLCIKIDSLEREEAIYEKMNIVNIISNVKKSIEFEKQGFLNEKSKIEVQMSLINMDVILQDIKKYEKKASSSK